MKTDYRDGSPLKTHTDGPAVISLSGRPVLLALAEVVLLHRSDGRTSRVLGHGVGEVDLNVRDLAAGLLVVKVSLNKSGMSVKVDVATVSRQGPRSDVRFLPGLSVDSRSAPLVSPDILDDDVQGLGVVVVEDEPAADARSAISAVAAVLVVGRGTFGEGGEDGAHLALAIFVFLGLHAAVAHGAVREAVLVCEVPLLVVCGADDRDGEGYLCGSVRRGAFE